MVQVPNERLAYLDDVEADKDIARPVQEQELMKETINADNEDKTEQHKPFGLKFIQICFCTIGVWLYTSHPSGKRKICKYLSGLLLLLAAGRVTFQNIQYLHKGKDSSSTTFVRKVLNVSESMAQMYCSFVLWRHEKSLAELYQFIPRTKFYSRKWKLIALPSVSFLVNSTVTIVKIHQHIFYPRPYSRGLTHFFISKWLFGIGWDFSMMLYFIIVWGMVDRVTLFSKAINHSIRQCDQLDFSDLSRRSFQFKSTLRQTLNSVNHVFSLMVFVLYLKIFLHFLTFLWQIVLPKTNHELFVTSTLLGYFLTELAGLSSISTLMIDKLKSTVDSFEKELIERSPPDILLISDIKRMLDFDPSRDALTIWDSFVFCKATTVTFLGGMVSCVAIILQFDLEVKDKLKL